MPSAGFGQRAIASVLRYGRCLNGYGHTGKNCILFTEYQISMVRLPRQRSAGVRVNPGLSTIRPDLGGRGSWKPVRHRCPGDLHLAPSWSVAPRAPPRISVVNPASNRSFARRIARWIVWRRVRTSRGSRAVNSRRTDTDSWTTRDAPESPRRPVSRPLDDSPGLFRHCLADRYAGIV